jgi:hypothetical protein
MAITSQHVISLLGYNTLFLNERWCVGVGMSEDAKREREGREVDVIWIEVDIERREEKRREEKCNVLFHCRDR